VKANTPNNIDDLYESLPEEERLIATILRDIIRDTLPEIREKKSYGVPFYRGKKTICYVWPASITWGGKQQGEGVTIGFYQARKLDHGGFLEFGTKKVIGHHRFLAAEEIEVEQLEAVLLAAWRVDAGV